MNIPKLVQMYIFKKLSCNIMHGRAPLKKI